MTVGDLPKDLQNLLDILSINNSVKSFSIYSERDGMCMKIRWHKCNDSDMPGILTGDQAQVKFGKVPPSKQLRIAQRANTRRITRSMNNKDKQQTEIPRCDSYSEETGAYVLSPVVCDISIPDLNHVNSTSSDSLLLRSPEQDNHNIEHGDQQSDHADVRATIEPLSYGECDPHRDHEQQSTLSLSPEMCDNESLLHDDDSENPSDTETLPDEKVTPGCNSFMCRYRDESVKQMMHFGKDIVKCSKCQLIRSYMCMSCHNHGKHKRHRKYCMTIPNNLK